MEGGWYQGGGGEEKPVPDQREKVKSNNNKDVECGEMVNWGKPNKAKEKCNLQKPEKKRWQPSRRRKEQLRGIVWEGKTTRGYQKPSEEMSPNSTFPAGELRHKFTI